MCGTDREARAAVPRYAGPRREARRRGSRAATSCPWVLPDLHLKCVGNAQNKSGGRGVSPLSRCGMFSSLRGIVHGLWTVAGAPTPAPACRWALLGRRCLWSGGVLHELEVFGTGVDNQHVAGIRERGPIGFEALVERIEVGVFSKGLGIQRAGLGIALPHDGRGLCVGLGKDDLALAVGLGTDFLAFGRTDRTQFVGHAGALGLHA